MQTGTVIAVAAIGLVPFAISQMQLFAFYAMPDTKTPALLNMPVVGIRILFDVVFYLVLPLALVDAGLMMANTISYVLAVVIGYALLRRRIGRLGIGETMRALDQTCRGSNRRWPRRLVPGDHRRAHAGQREGSLDHHARRRQCCAASRLRGDGGSPQGTRYQ